MPTRILIRNEVRYRSRNYQTAPASMPPHAAREGAACVMETIPAHSTQSQFREGEAWTCPQDGITYRVVGRGRLKPADGWGRMEFWLDRYRAMTDDIEILIERGLLDAAIEAQSPVKRYRCRDEERVKEYLKSRYPRRQRLVKPNRP